PTSDRNNSPMLAAEHDRPAVLLSGRPGRAAGAEKAFSVGKGLVRLEDQVACHFWITTIFVDGKSIGQRRAPEHQAVGDECLWRRLHRSPLRGLTLAVRSRGDR